MIVLLTDREGYIVSANPSAEALLELGKSGLAKADLAVCREAGGIPSQALVYRIEQAQ